MALPKSGGYNYTRHAMVNGVAHETVQAIYNASSVDFMVWTNVTSRSFRVRSIQLRTEVKGSNGSAVTISAEKFASGTALGSGTKLQAAVQTLKGTNATTVSITLSTTKGDLSIPPGTSIGIEFAGTLTAAVGVLSIDLVPY